jgi:hypothetical protein
MSRRAFVTPAIVALTFARIHRAHRASSLTEVAADEHIKIAARTPEPYVRIMKLTSRPSSVNGDYICILPANMYQAN